MPRTAAAFLVGSLAIVGLPPLNGFVSEWLIFLGLLRTGETSGALRAASTATAALALTGALALACFTKLYGTVFHGLPRATATLTGRGGEAGLSAPQLVLATACLAIGVVPLAVIPGAVRAAGMVLGDSGAVEDVVKASTLAAAISVMAVALLALVALMWGVRARVPARGPARVAVTWGCAYPGVTGRMQYSASSFAAGLLALFGRISGSRVESGPGTFHVRAVDPVLDTLGRPLWDSLVGRAASRLRVLQTGRLRWYLVYVITALLALLLYLWGKTT
jgi:hydrogenase-4 component B